MFDALTTDRDHEYLMLDSIIVRASAGGHRKGGWEKALGRSRSGLTTKIHIAGDAPRALVLVEGFRPRHVLADAAYDANAIRNRIADIGAEAVIPCNPMQKRFIGYDAEIYKHKKPHRTLLQQDPALPAHRNPIRPKSNTLPSLHLYRRSYDMDAINVEPA
ncbi:MAG: hypothetical protein OXH94_08365 [Rhodospirillales bacterium]|nr:hypothetical protein [Rhodospirillales bacterium]